MPPKNAWPTDHRVSLHVRSKSVALVSAASASVPASGSGEPLGQMFECIANPTQSIRGFDGIRINKDWHLKRDPGN
jgi:hypothetical protein